MHFHTCRFNFINTTKFSVNAQAHGVFRSTERQSAETLEQLDRLQTICLTPHCSPLPCPVVIPSIYQLVALPVERAKSYSSVSRNEA